VRCRLQRAEKTQPTDDETFMVVNIREQVVKGDAEGEKLAGCWAGI
jgi:hypothetical protein